MARFGRWFRMAVIAAAVGVGVTPAVPAAALTGDGAPMGGASPASGKTVIGALATLRQAADKIDAERAATEMLLAQVADPNNPAVARLDVRLSALEQEVRALTGRIEQLGYQVRQLNERVDTVMGDMEFRVGRLEQGTSAGDRSANAPSEAPSQPQTERVPSQPPRSSSLPEMGQTERVVERPGVLGDVPRSGSDDSLGAGRVRTSEAPMAEGTPQQQYAYAFDLLRSADYERAEEALKSFVARNPSDPLANNARYWLGETYYVRGQYAEAAQAFVEAYESNNTGPKAPDALLKLGMSLARLDKQDEACATFRELSRTQPDAPAAITAKAATERERIGCP